MYDSNVPSSNRAKFAAARITEFRNAFEVTPGAWEVDNKLCLELDEAQEPFPESKNLWPADPKKNFVDNLAAARQDQEKRKT